MATMRRERLVVAPLLTGTEGKVAIKLMERVRMFLDFIDRRL